MSFKLGAGVLALLAGLAASSAQAADFEFWHPFGGHNGEVVQQLVDKFNTEHPGITVNAVFKGGYAEVLNGSIAAFRAGKAPGLIVVQARNAPTMLTSGAALPVYELMPEAGFNVDWNDFIRPALAMFSDDKGPVSLPFNSSTPILWYNVDAFEKAGIASVPKTWDDMEEAAKKIKASGYDCALTAGWPHWVHLDAYSQIHRIEVATNNNGMDGWDTKFTFDKQPMYVNHIKRLKRWIDEGLYTYSGRTGQGADAAFNSEQCAIMLESSAAYGGIKAGAKFKFAAGYMPYEKGTESPANSLIGGGTLFVLKGQTDENNKAIATFLDYLTQVPQQLYWHKETGYVPISLKAYEAAKAEGYYDENPHQELAILQLDRGGAPGPFNRGFRFGYASQVYDVMSEELERVWSGETDVDTALSDSVRRGDEIIERFVRSIGQ